MYALGQTMPKCHVPGRDIFLHLKEGFPKLKNQVSEDPQKLNYIDVSAVQFFIFFEYTKWH